LSAREDSEEVVVPFPLPREQLARPTRVRSTLIASSIRALRDRNLFDVYKAALHPAYRPVVLECVAGTWLSFEAGLAHYRACDSLGLSTMDQISIGREVGDRIHGTFLGTMLRAAKTVGVTPWTGFPYTAKLYERIFDGGGCCVTKVGPKDARMEVAGNPMVGIRYFCHGMRGLWQVALELFCRKAYLVELEQTPTSYRVKVSWA
jgi:hypothetical protein